MVEAVFGKSRVLTGRILMEVVVVWRSVRPQNREIDGIAGDLAEMAVRVNLGLCRMEIAA